MGGYGNLAAMALPPGGPKPKFPEVENLPLVSAEILTKDQVRSLTRSVDKTLAGATARAAKFDKRIETLETDPDIFVSLKPGYKLPSGDTSFGASSLSEVRSMMKNILKE
jgi:hypothetical protein